MSLDLRIAIGWLLLALGTQLVAFGFFSEGRTAALNLGWGGAIAGVGLIFHVIVRLRRKA